MFKKFTSLLAAVSLLKLRHCKTGKRSGSRYDRSDHNDGGSD